MLDTCNVTEIITKLGLDTNGLLHVSYFKGDGDIVVEILAFVEEGRREIEEDKLLKPEGKT